MDERRLPPRAMHCQGLEMQEDSQTKMTSQIWSTQPSIPPGSVNEHQLRLGRQRQVWLIPIADERVGVQVKL